MDAIDWIIRVGVIVGGVSYLIRQFKNGRKDYDKEVEAETDRVLKVREQKIKDLEEEKTKLLAEKNQVALENSVLTNKAFGKEILDKIQSTLDTMTAHSLNLEKIITQFIPLLGPDGLLEKFAQNDQTIITKIDDLHKDVRDGFKLPAKLDGQSEQDLN